ncbi:hypothetical protein B0T22DRAFT_230163 [Podospora appendiculata]|uniref:Uncharacterized protein n=1 Tax=Podospora appendiculata TaxID=314037 RepID=A0AAE0X6B6_9PEZI|nr:hypothetical protein B0T22DRAFT_230163 [Podospora appendiculata]
MDPGSERPKSAQTMHLTADATKRALLKDPPRENSHLHLNKFFELLSVSLFLFSKHLLAQQIAIEAHQRRETKATLVLVLFSFNISIHALGESPRTWLFYKAAAETRRHRSTAADLGRLFLVCLRQPCLLAKSAYLLVRGFGYALPGRRPHGRRYESALSAVWGVCAVVRGGILVDDGQPLVGRDRGCHGWLERFRHDIQVMRLLVLFSRRHELLDGAYSWCEGGLQTKPNLYRLSRGAVDSRMPNTLGFAGSLFVLGCLPLMRRATVGTRGVQVRVMITLYRVKL